MTVDILLPFYGDVAMMKAAVRSVLRQDNPAWRLVVVDDGFPDNSIPGWFDELKDPRVEYHRNTVNLGANGNYRKCLTMVRNPLVQVMGADDIMLPSYVDWLISSAQGHPDAQVFQPGVLVIDERDAPSQTLVEKVKDFYRPKTTQPVEIHGEDLALSVLRGNWLYFPSLAWRANTITSVGFREGLNVTQDIALVCDVAMGGGTLLFDPAVHFLYRRHSASDSSWRALDGTRFTEERQFFDQMAHEMKTLGWDRASRAASLRVSSRAHAASLLPKASAKKNWRGARTLARHIFS